MKEELKSNLEDREKNRIRIKDDNKSEYNKLFSLLRMMNIDCKTETVEKESMCGTKFLEEYLIIEYDR